MHNKAVSIDELLNIPRAKWEILAEKKIYFAHQSVGFNLIEGVNVLLQEIPDIKLTIKETKSASEFNQPVLAHSKIGKNRDPRMKCEDFITNLKSGIGNNVDIAFVKLCYVDIMKGTDVEAVFNYYVQTMNKLQTSYPKVHFIYLTVPLTAYDNSLKMRIKRVLGFGDYNIDDNIARNNFNEFVRAKYSAGGDLFDIADIESTTLSGDKSIFTVKGRQYYSMASEWTSDGGHFNEAGSKYLAKAFLIFLINRM